VPFPGASHTARPRAALASAHGVVSVRTVN